MFIYVNNDFIETRVNILKTYDGRFQKPPYFGGCNSFGNVGAHITVIKPNEMNKITSARENGLKQIIQGFPVIDFKIEKCNLVHKKSWHRKYFIKRNVDLLLLEVRASELDNVREKCGLPPMQHPFHITLAMRYKYVSMLKCFGC